MAEQLPCPKLYEGHDAGHYTLPAEVVKARDTFQKIAAMPFPKPPRNSWETVDDVARATVDAVHAGTKLPDVTLIEQARQAERIYQDALDMMGACQDMAAQRARTALGEHALDIISDHLRPAHEETWQAYQDAHGVLNEYGEHEHRRLLNAPSKVRKAADTCDLMAERYTAIQAARGDLWLQAGVRCPEDPSGKYTAIRNFHTLHPSRLAMMRTAWHGLDPRRFLAWMADHDGQLWMPTPDEQAQAVQAETHIGQPFRSRAA
ncbi:hypothetical protein [Streptomyces flavidovirens]|uniref:Uncharacterized protein n=1 Tax=Streptomyces flavidovirens TaxID=67298 RepID=A0ABW6R912_9ACTN